MLLLPTSLVFYRTNLIVKQLYLRDPPTGHRSPPSSGYLGHAVSHRKTGCVFFKLWGSNLSQFFRIQFKGVRLQLLAPICKTEKSEQRHLSTGGVSPCSRWGCRQILHQSFPSLVGLCLSLTDAVISLVPPGSTTKTGWRYTSSRPDGIPD